MNLIKNLSLKKKLLTVILFTTGVTLLLISSGFILEEQGHVNEEILEELGILTDVIGTCSSAALSFDDAVVGAEILQSLSAKPWLVAGILRRTDGTRFAHYVAPEYEQQVDSDFEWPEAVWNQAMTPSGFAMDQYMCVARPIVFDGEQIGSILLLTDRKQLVDRIYGAISFTALIMGVSFMISILLALRLQHLISKPILDLTQTMAKVSETKDYSLRAKGYGRDELGRLVTGFNAMIEQVQSGKLALQQYNVKLESTVEERTEELVMAKEAAETANEAKSRFLATMSHEIRTPLNGVVGMLMLLQKSALNGQQKRFVKKGILSSDALLSIISDILDFSKIESGKLEIEHAPFELVSVIENVIQMFAQQAEDKELELACLIQNNVPTHVMGDSSRIGQVLINLLGNAIKFTEQGDIVVRVAQEIIHDDEMVRIEIKDSGVGISLKDKERLFEPFLQEDASTTRRFGGTGLGLGISRQLVELMGGEIGVDSQPGQGSTFWFTLKLDQLEAKDIPDRVDSMRGLRALVVDDHAVSREIIGYELDTWGCLSAGVEDGMSALALMRRQAAEGHPFNFAVIDWDMPGINGEELGRRIKADPQLADTTLIMLSSVSEVCGAHLEQIGFSSWISKPARQSELYNTILNALNGVQDEHGNLTVAAPTQVQAGKVNILLAEDNEINQEVACEILAMSGYSCDVANNGDEAVAAVVAGEYDLVFMDCMMPKTDGYEATRRIREREAAEERMPIIALTANAMEGDRQLCLDAGMDDYLTKPLDPDLMVSMISKWCTFPSTEEQPPLRGEEGAASGEKAIPMFDRPAVLNRCMGNAELLIKLVAKFFEQTDMDMGHLGEALTAENLSDAVHASHRIKGASANLSMEYLRDAAERVELHARDEKLDEATHAFESLNMELVRVKQHISKEHADL